MRALFVSLMILSASATAMAGLSSIRHSGESFEAARQRSTPVWELFGRGSYPDRMKKPMKELNIQDIPDVGSYADLEREFKYVRDTRFIADAEPFARRLTWMYPDDGCYARAELAATELVEHQFTTPKKIFVFGNLYAPTQNAPGGSVSWWYHVAVTYRVGNEVYVFDPAINPEKPVTLVEWNKAVGGEKSQVQYTICSHKTFDPGSDCLNPRALSEQEAISEQKNFLSLEWNRLLDLDRDPEKELGNEPPWL
ncbi:protein-glutamine glutaminase family protein [Bdellovibrio bacteriovorus]|uniref:protein-glutamine glutaminase family protein n=1 Tax=Bdellovibrio bacteriovorus TaxID=959 RepID=UPI003D04E910